MSRCIVIAEAGVNHNGSLQTAYELIDAAVEAGADFVKFQTFRAEKLVTAIAPKAGYQKESTDRHESQYAMLKHLELSHEDFRHLASYCKSKDIGFLSTPFDDEALSFLTTLNLPFLKVSSGDLTNIPFLVEISKLNIPVILSTGMAKMAEVEEAVEAIEQAGLPIEKLTILHCTTEYPAPPSEVNLRAMLTLQKAFPSAVIGYSDHTDGIEISIAAVALGAQVIEKHFTLDKLMEGPDHQASLTPVELAHLVSGIRKVEMAMGNGRKCPSASEIPNRLVARKSIVATKSIAKGEVFSLENVAIRRPGTGLAPKHWSQILGRKASKDFLKDEPLPVGIFS